MTRTPLRFARGRSLPARGFSDREKYPHNPDYVTECPGGESLDISIALSEASDLRRVWNEVSLLIGGALARRARCDNQEI